jgi:hypothetical protein
MYRYTRGCLRPCMYDCRKGDIDPVSRILGWNCLGECRYKCMHEVTAERMQNGLPMLQYHGRWPFIRVLGVENPASSFFSLANAAPHVYFGLFRRSEYVPAHGYMRPWLLMYSLVCAYAWICSAAYHARETALTTKLDFSGALVLLVFASCLALRRLIGPTGSSSRGILIFLVFSTAALATVMQIRRLFDGSVGAR